MPSLNVGDVTFLGNGKPALVVGFNENTGEYITRTKGEEFEKTRKNTFINGLSPEERGRYNEIVDKVHNLNDPKKKIEELVSKIEKFKMDPRQHKITRYLESELFHTMQNFGVEPREYMVEESKVSA
ncbi:MAG: hypothetical protein HQK54_13585 [Oligoflexales bacterium]|nr:hypothetical protein [Oligoflexales bacterium]